MKPLPVAVTARGFSNSANKPMTQHEKNCEIIRISVRIEMLASQATFRSKPIGDITAELARIADELRELTKSK